jgi:hypothetical protein
MQQCSARKRERQENVTILDWAIDGLRQPPLRAHDHQDALRLVASWADAFKTLV